MASFHTDETAPEPGRNPGTATGGAVLVTGAARGLGAVIARRLAADGWPVAVNYRSNRGLADDLVERIGATGGTAAAFAADVTDETAVERLAAEVEDQLGPIGALVVNATGPQPRAEVSELSWRAELDQLEFFVKSPTLLTRAVLPSMRAAGGGRIVQIGSDVIERVLAGDSAYASAKAAQHMLTRVWARELGPDKITVNTVAPGWIPVERHAGADPAALSAYAERVPLRRMGEPIEVAEVVAYLLSDRAAFVTGQWIAVNGGHTVGSG